MSLFRILVLVQVVLALYVCWLGVGVFFASAHSGSDVRFPFRELKSGLERKGTITLQQVTQAEKSIGSSLQSRNEKYFDLTIRIGITGLFQAMLAASLLVYRHGAAKTNGSDT